MKILKRDWKWRVLFIAILIGLFGYVYRDLFHWQMLAMFDLAPWSKTPGELYEAFSSSWRHLWLGMHHCMGSGDFLVQSSLITLFGGNAAMAQRIFWLSIMPLSAITMRIFLERFTSSNIAKLIIPFAYAVNGLTICWFQIGTYSFLPQFIAFPLMMLYLIKILEEKERRWLHVLIFSAIHALQVSWVVYGVLYFMPFVIIFFLVEVIKRRNWGYTAKTALLFMASYGIVFLLVAPVGFDQLLNMFGYYAAPTDSFGVYARLPMEWLVQSTQAAYTWKEAVLMFQSLTFLLGMFALGTLLVRHRTSLKYYLSLLLVATMLLLFSRLVSAELILSWFTAFPVLFALMQPAKLAMIIAWSMFAMMAILVSEVEARIALRHKATL